MNALAVLWAIPALSAAAFGLLRLVSRDHARAALTTAAGLWTLATLVALPLILNR